MVTIEVPPRIRPLQRITSAWLNSIVEAIEKLSKTVTSGEEDIYVRELIAHLVRTESADILNGYIANLLVDYVGGERGWFRDLFSEYLQAGQIRSSGGQITYLSADTLQANSVEGKKGVFESSVTTSLVDARVGNFSDSLFVAGVPVTPGGGGGGALPYVPVVDKVVTSDEIGVVPFGSEYDVKTLTVKGYLHVKGTVQAFGSVDVQGETVMLGDVDVHTLPPYAPLPSDKNSSGIDPNSPPWAPPDGWTQIVEFTSPDDIDFFTYWEGNMTVENHMLKVPFDGVTEAYAERYESGVSTWQRTAVCFLPVNRLTTYEGHIMYFDTWYLKRNVAGLAASIYQKMADGNKIYLEDGYGGIREEFEFKGDWIVAVYDYQNRRAAIYDRNGKTLVSLSLTSWPPGTDLQLIDFYIFRKAYPGTLFYIDWIAIK